MGAPAVADLTEKQFRTNKITAAPLSPKAWSDDFGND